ncbi:MAG: Fic family protein [Oscillospiraceae bacterium]|nr:Fic family protein [Oscillospiraceae bacterium]
MFAEVERLYAELKGIRPLSSESVRRLAEDFVLDYTYNSNAIEGSTLTLDETALVLKEDVTISGKPLSHHLEAIGHRDAYYYIENLVKNKIPITEKAIKNIHSLVLAGRQEDKGVYRSVPVRVGSYTPCQPFEIPVKMEQLMNEYNTCMKDLHMIELTAIFHLKFEKIHPFVDGNGRVGRLLLNFELMRNGYPPINIKFTDRQRYYECFNQDSGGSETGSKMVKLVCDYVTYELKRYIEIAKQSEMIREQTN